MERLTKWLDGKKAICIKECEKKCIDGNEWCPKCKPLTDVLVKLADYEDKQEQGLLIELPVPIGGTVWGWEYPTRIDEKDGSVWTICDRKMAKVVPKKFHLMMLDRMGDMYFETEAEAKEALAKMGGK